MSIQKITYKLAHDALVLALITYGAFICTDIIFPGFLTHIISPTTIIFIIAILLLIIAITQNNTERTVSVHNNTNSFIFIAIGTIGLLCILLTLRSFRLWEQLLIIMLLVALATSLVRSDSTKNHACADDHAQ